MAQTKEATPIQQEHTEPYPCPACATFVAAKEAICPSCGEVLRHSPRFAVVQATHADWRDVGLPYMAAFWVLLQAGGLFVLNGTAYLGYVVTGLSALMFVPIVGRMDWASGMTKFVCGVTAVRGGFLIYDSLAHGPQSPWAAVIGGVLMVASLILGCMIYYNEE
ncbi:MAG: hypothetical protein KF784_07515 [Fimbriimonadaceae bacterium]|nr:hypothetical protein [Fimbriimonadaceae bacterium]